MPHRQASSGCGTLETLFLPVPLLELSPDASAMTLPSLFFFFFFFFFKIYLYLFMIDMEGGQRHRQREKQATCREPNMGLDPGTPGSGPGPKAGVKLLSHPGIPSITLLFSVLSHLHLLPCWPVCAYPSPQTQSSQYSQQPVLFFCSSSGQNLQPWITLTSTFCALTLATATYWREDRKSYNGRIWLLYNHGLSFWLGP